MQGGLDCGKGSSGLSQRPFCSFVAGASLQSTDSLQSRHCSFFSRSSSGTRGSASDSTQARGVRTSDSANISPAMPRLNAIWCCRIIMTLASLTSIPKVGLRRKCRRVSELGYRELYRGCCEQSHCLYAWKPETIHHLFPTPEKCGCSISSIHFAPNTLKCHASIQFEREVNHDARRTDDLHALSL